jgi:hypothetical protein
MAGDLYSRAFSSHRLIQVHSGSLQNGKTFSSVHTNHHFPRAAEFSWGIHVQLKRATFTTTHFLRNCSIGFPFLTLVMLLLAALAPLVVLATGVIAGPPLARDSLIRVPITQRTNFNGIPDFTTRGREHMRNLVKRGGHRRQSSTVNKTPSIPLNYTGGVYVATIGVGEPAKNCESCKSLPRMVTYNLAPKTDSWLIQGVPSPGWGRTRTTPTLKPRAV